MDYDDINYDEGYSIRDIDNNWLIQKITIFYKEKHWNIGEN